MKFISLQKNTQKGFTIIETLVAITILMISIAGPLTVAEKGLSAAELAHDQVIASYLAQDGIEYIKNVRDDNVLNGRSWLSQFTASNGQINSGICASSGSPCGIDTFEGNRNGLTIAALKISKCDPATTCILYDGVNGYGTDSSSGSASQYSRYFYFSQNPNNYDEADVTVIVQWYSGTLLNQITYQDEIFNITK